MRDSLDSLVVTFRELHHLGYEPRRVVDKYLRNKHPLVVNIQLVLLVLQFFLLTASVYS